MVPLIEQHRQQIEALCRKHGITRLELFGSATDPARFDPAKSDVDFLYEIDDDLPRLADRYFNFLWELERLLGRKVDLVAFHQATNPYFIERVNSERTLLHAS